MSAFRDKRGGGGKVWEIYSTDSWVIFMLIISKAVFFFKKSHLGVQWLEIIKNAFTFYIIAKAPEPSMTLD